VVNEWLAADLKLKPGDSRAGRRTIGVDAGTQLVERTNTFRVRSIVPLRGTACGSNADAGNSLASPKAGARATWDAGFDLIHPIRRQGRSLLEAVARHSKGVHHPRRGADVGQSIEI
jgi:hypothetical protein